MIGALPVGQDLVGIGVNVALILVDLPDLVHPVFNIFVPVYLPRANVEQLPELLGGQHLGSLDLQGPQRVLLALIHRYGDIQLIFLFLQRLGLWMLSDQLDLRISDLDVLEPVVHVKLLEVILVLFPVFLRIDNLLSNKPVPGLLFDLLERSA